MSDVIDHYETLLAPHYTWMLGPDFDELVAEQRRILDLPGRPESGIALDLGCGSGIQSVALAQLGYETVLGVDASQTLIAELTRRAAQISAIQPIHADVCAGLDETARPGSVTIAVCMGDTLTHLPQRAAVRRLFDDVHAVLGADGVFVLSFRDMTQKLDGLDRFIQVRADHDRIMTCFLEDEGDSVHVHDLIHRKDLDGKWNLTKSSYRKLRLSPEWVIEQLREAGFTVDPVQAGPRGMCVVVAHRAATVIATGEG